MTIFFGGDVDVREAGESAASLGRCVFPTARCRGEAVSGMSHIFGPGGSEAYAQETWPSVKGVQAQFLISARDTTNHPRLMLALRSNLSLGHVQSRNDPGLQLEAM